MRQTRFWRVMTAFLLVFMLTLVQITALASPAGPETIEQLMQNPDAGITRGEFAMLLNEILTLQESIGNGFKDVTADHPYAAEKTIGRLCSDLVKTTGQPNSDLVKTTGQPNSDLVKTTGRLCCGVH